MPQRAVQFRGWILAGFAALVLLGCLRAQADELSGDFQPADLSSSFANGRSSVIPCESEANASRLRLTFPVQSPFA
jgi:hypothetical protein